MNNFENSIEVNVDTFESPKEIEMYTDSELVQLPEINTNHLLSQKWEINRKVAEKFIDYIKNKSVRKIVDINCGNGWFTNLIAKNNYANVLGISSNVKELHRAQKIFTKDNLSFKENNVLKDDFQGKFDIIILHNTLVNYPNLSELLTKLKSILDKDGEIHILEYPVTENKHIAELADFKLIYEPNSIVKKFFAKKTLPFVWYMYQQD